MPLLPVSHKLCHNPRTFVCHPTDFLLVAITPLISFSWLTDRKFPSTIYPYDWIASQLCCVNCRFSLLTVVMTGHVSCVHCEMLHTHWRSELGNECSNQVLILVVAISNTTAVMGYFPIARFLVVVTEVGSSAKCVLWYMFGVCCTD